MSCYWIDATPYCDHGCRVIDRWYDGVSEWMSYSCAPLGVGPPPEFVIAIAVGAVLIITLIIAVATGGVGSTDAAQIDSDTAATDEITRDMETAIRKADAHIQNMLSKHRNGDRYDR